MGFLKRLFGGGEKESQEGGYTDPHGIYFYVQCDHCGTIVRLRADKRHDLNRVDGGFAWHKTVVDSRCFRPIPTTVYLDQNFQVTEQEIEGGRYVSQEAYEAQE